MISFRIDWFDLLAVQGIAYTLNYLQIWSLWCSSFSLCIRENTIHSTANGNELKAVHWVPRGSADSPWF